MSIKSDYPEVMETNDAAMDLGFLLQKISAVIGKLGPSELQQLRSHVDAALLTRTLALGHEYGESVRQLTQQIDVWREKELAARRAARKQAQVRIGSQKATTIINGSVEQLTLISGEKSA